MNFKVQTLKTGVKNGSQRENEYKQEKNFHVSFFTLSVHAKQISLHARTTVAILELEREHLDTFFLRKKYLGNCESVLEIV